MKDLSPRLLLIFFLACAVPLAFAAYTQHAFEDFYITFRVSKNLATGHGLVFNVGGDNKVRAYDEDTGKVLWEHAIAGNSTGCPSIYEIDGREYLVITVAGPFVGGRGGGGGNANSGLPSGYVVFALPRKG